MTKLRRDAGSNYLARKRLPDDVREEYGRLYGARYEAKFSAPRTTKSHEAQQRFAHGLLKSKAGLPPSVQSATEPGAVSRELGRASSRAIGMSGSQGATPRRATTS
jgi:hypothetical protein